MCMQTHAESHVLWHQKRGGGWYKGKLDPWLWWEWVSARWIHRAVFVVSQMYLWFWCIFDFTDTFVILGWVPSQMYMCPKIFVWFRGKCPAFVIYIKNEWTTFDLVWYQDVKSSHHWGPQDIRLQHTATHCNTLQHTATHCNTLQHTASHLFCWGSLTLISRSSYIDINALIIEALVIEALQTFGILFMFY